MNTVWDRPRKRSLRYKLWSGYYGITLYVRHVLPLDLLIVAQFTRNVLVRIF
jgi:hypothetical protein